MSDATQPEEWSEVIARMNEAVADSVEQNVAAQAAFFESWSEVFEDSVPEEDVVAEGIEGYNRAYEVWMDAAEEVLARTSDVAQGEDVETEEIRDVWLESANEAFKEVMSTSAFAAANGRLVSALMEAQQDVDEATQTSLSRMGLPTRENVEEIGARLVELERRQHDVEDKLDRIIDELED